MKILIITDLEGVAGVITYEEYCVPSGKFYKRACELATLEANAAIEGALEAGADLIEVLDGHGQGGIDQNLLHPRAKRVVASGKKYPFNLDGSFDAVILLGHHAKAGTIKDPFPHTGTFNVLEFSINGHSLGEVGKNALMCSYFMVPLIMVSGTAGACEEALHIAPDIETVITTAYADRIQSLNTVPRDAWVQVGELIHLPTKLAQEQIRAAVIRGITKRKQIRQFWLSPPYEEILEIKRWIRRRLVRHDNDLIRLLNI